MAKLGASTSIGVFFGADSDHGFEQALGIEPAKADMIGEGLKGRALFTVLDESTQCCRELSVSFDRGWLFGFAAFAGAKSSFLGQRSGHVEGNVFRVCQASGTGGITIDSGAAYGIVEGAVCCLFSIFDTSPTRIFFNWALSWARHTGYSFGETGFQPHRVKFRQHPGVRIVRRNAMGERYPLL